MNNLTNMTAEELLLARIMGTFTTPAIDAELDRRSDLARYLLNKPLLPTAVAMLAAVAA